MRRACRQEGAKLQLDKGRQALAEKGAWSWWLLVVEAGFDCLHVKRLGKREDGSRCVAAERGVSRSCVRFPLILASAPLCSAPTQAAVCALLTCLHTLVSTAHSAHLPTHTHAHPDDRSSRSAAGSR